MPTDLKDKIVSWMLDEDHDVSKESVPPEAPVEWVIGVTVKAPVRVKLLIQQPKAKRDRIAVTLGVLVSPVHQQALADRGQQETVRIMARILEDLMLLCPDCLILVQPSLTTPQNIVLTKILYEEEVTRAKLTATVRMLVNAYILLITVMNSELGVTPKRRGEDQSSPSFI